MKNREIVAEMFAELTRLDRIMILVTSDNQRYMVSKISGLAGATFYHTVEGKIFVAAEINRTLIL